MTSQQTEALAAPDLTEHSAAGGLQPAVAPSQPGPEEPARQQLLDLPTELLRDIFSDTPHRLRSTHRTVRDLLDRACRELRLRKPDPRTARPQDLGTLLRRLPQLRSLDTGLGAPNLRTLPSLAGLSSLETLSLAGCHKLLNLDAVTALTALRSLDLSDCRALSGLGPLAHCPHLTSLRLTRGRGGEADLAALAAVPSLQSLCLHNNEDPTRRSTMGPVDLSPLTACASLTHLDVRGHNMCNSGRVGDLQPLSHLTRLATLFLEIDDEVADLAPLAASRASLTHLSLNGFAVLTVAPLAACVNLTSLRLRLAGLRHLQPLQACTRLSTLTLDDCPFLSELGPLAALAPSLTALSLQDSRRCAFTLESLLPLTELRDLDLSRTSARSVLPFAALPKLALLRLLGCQVQPAEVDQLRVVCGPRLTVEGP